MDVSKLQRLADLGFQMLPLPNIANHFALERGGFAALVSVRNEEIGDAGAPGLLTESGLAVLVWREGEAWFVAKGFERPAGAEEVEAIRQFGRDVNSALRH